MMEAMFGLGRNQLVLGYGISDCIPTAHLTCTAYFLYHSLKLMHLCKRVSPTRQHDMVIGMVLSVFASMHSVGKCVSNEPLLRARRYWQCWYAAKL